MACNPQGDSGEHKGSLRPSKAQCDPGMSDTSHTPLPGCGNILWTPGTSQCPWWVQPI